MGNASQEMRLSRRVVRAIGWDTAGSLAVSLITFLTTVWLVRTLGPSHYGVLSALLAAVGLSQVLTAGGVRFALLRFIPQVEAEGGLPAVARLLRTTAGGRTVILLAFSVPLLAAPEFVGQTVLGRPELVPYVRLMPLLIGLPLYADVLSAALIALFRQPAVRLAEVANKVVFAACLVSIPLFEDPLHGVILAWVSSWLCGIVWMAVAATRHGISRLPTNASRPVGYRRLMQFAGTAWSLSLVGFVLGRELDILLLTRLGAPAEILAQYAVAFAFVTLVYRLPLLPIAGGFDQPLIAGLHVKGDRDALRRLYNAYFEYVYFFVLPILGGGVLLGPALVEEIYGAEYRESGPVFMALLVLLGLSKLVGITGSFLLATDHELTKLRIRTATALLNVVLALICIPVWGALGAAAATGAAMVVLTAIELGVVQRSLRPRFPWRFLAGTGLCVGAMMLVVEALERWYGSAPTLIPLVGLVLVGGLAYATMLLIVRPLSSDQAELLTTGGAPAIAAMIKRISRRPSAVSSAEVAHRSDSR